MKKIIILIIAIMLILTSCVSTSTDELANEQSASNDKFRLTIYVDETIVNTKTPVTCYATLKYLGDETITVYHSTPLVGFGIEDSKYFDGSYMLLTELVRTTFNKGDEVTYEFSKSGSWSAEDEYAEFYEQYYHQEQLILPKGEYILSAHLEYSMDENDVLGTMKHVTSQLKIIVKR